ncbi:MAG: Holliday junction branch migration protein RuvA [Cyanobacteriota bacterium]|nr:Holliday junction branch migration protein RuvA [Cyanobacteriota bacterium]
MIGWLQGILADPWQQGQRQGVLLVCQGVGYELQITARLWRQLPTTGHELGLHIHTACRDDGWVLFGFPARCERDLFRELVAVSGVGPQMALGLLGAMEVQELVQAIVQGDLRRLAAAPGVGRRTAERLSVDLRKRLAERFALLAGAQPDDPLDGAPLPLANPGREEVQITLAALGYDPLEIQQALRAVAASSAPATTDDWLRDCLRWLADAEA